MTIASTPPSTTRTGSDPIDRRSEDVLAREHLELVRKMVARTATRVPAHVSRDDLLSAAMAGLAMAARHFDAARGVPFERYAATRIRGALIDELRACDWASRPVRTKARALASVNEQLTAGLGRTPTSQELAAAAGLSVDSLGRLNDDVHRALVLNYEAILETGDSEMLLPSADGDPEEELLSRERADCLTRAVEALPERLRTVVHGYFFAERTVADIAAELGVTQSRVSQLRSEAMELLRDGVNAQLDPASVTPLRRPSGRVSRRQVAYRATMADRVAPSRVGATPSRVGATPTRVGATPTRVGAAPPRVAATVSCVGATHARVGAAPPRVAATVSCGGATHARVGAIPSRVAVAG